ncbi:conserved exported hypothetical protein [Candidatus Desulfarcum epimagneticum]|uniref:Chalcone isomerase domain-containing protein n=1 Tax=uncultured Desulfobacteraceae bacterium TaxID=218296 RepID=A0A484HDF8_9BACT|nr:conserved exported hypothetical protein [uncultured Desulfobacteraceae bacterium]
MMKKFLAAVVSVSLMALFAPGAFSGERTLLGVSFPEEKIIEGKVLKLNGLAYRKALGFIKVYVAGLYLENPTQDPEEVIESEQMKYLETQYLTKKATAEKLRNGFIDLMEKCNSKEMVAAHRGHIDRYASWLDKDMAPGLSSSSLYIPGKGLSLTYQGEVRGTIPGKEFARMYYRYNVGKKASKKIRKGLLGIQ